MKKSIRNIALSALLTVGAFFAITYTSCNKDKCKDVVCNNGTCVDGSCSCTSGYEGTNCQTLSRDKFARGTAWTAIDITPSGNTLAYTSIITPRSTAVTDVTISAIRGDQSSGTTSFFGNAITATVDGNTITIPSQKPDPNGGYTVLGTGTYSTTGTGKISWNYTLTEIATGTPKNYTGTWQ